jgi:hypothetical protein
VPFDFVVNPQCRGINTEHGARIVTVALIVIDSPATSCDGSMTRSVISNVDFSICSAPIIARVEKPGRTVTKFIRSASSPMRLDRCGIHVFVSSSRRLNSTDHLCTRFAAIQLFSTENIAAVANTSSGSALFTSIFKNALAMRPSGKGGNSGRVAEDSRPSLSMKTLTSRRSCEKRARIPSIPYGLPN